MEAWLYLSVGIATIALTCMKPRWFWQHPKALILRNTVGDVPTAMFYYLVGVFGIVLGLVKLSMR
jgi:hypothetical protein